MEKKSWKMYASGAVGLLSGLAMLIKCFVDNDFTHMAEAIALLTGGGAVIGASHKADKAIAKLAICFLVLPFLAGCGKNYSVCTGLEAPDQPAPIICQITQDNPELLDTALLTANFIEIKSGKYTGAQAAGVINNMLEQINISREGLTGSQLAFIIQESLPIGGDGAAVLIITQPYLNLFTGKYSGPLDDFTIDWVVRHLLAQKAIALTQMK